MTTYNFFELYLFHHLDTSQECDFLSGTGTQIRTAGKLGHYAGTQIMEVNPKAGNTQAKKKDIKPGMLK